MGHITFRRLMDFARNGSHLGLRCANSYCGHEGVVNAVDAHQWFMVHRWNDHIRDGLGPSALNRFRCSRCGDKAGKAFPTESPITVIDFFPANAAGWKLLIRRLRD